MQSNRIESNRIEFKPTPLEMITVSGFFPVSRGWMGVTGSSISFLFEISNKEKSCFAIERSGKIRQSISIKNRAEESRYSASSGSAANQLRLGTDPVASYNAV